MAVAVSLVEARYVNGGSSDTSGSFNITAGDLFVVWATEAEGGSDLTYTPSNSGTALTWAQRVDVAPANRCKIEFWTAYASGAQTGVTVSVSNGGTSRHWRWGIIRVTGHNESTWGGNVSDVDSTDTTAPYSQSVTMQATGNVAIWAWGDWNAADASGRSQYPSGSTELDYYRDSAELTCGVSYKALSSGAQSVGIDNFSGGDVAVGAVEVRSSVAPAAVAAVAAVPAAAVTHNTPVFVGKSATITPGTTSCSCTYPTGLAAGDLLILHVTNKYPANGPSDPAGWSKIGPVDTSGGSAAADTGNSRNTVYWKRSDGTESGTISLTMTSCNTSYAVCYAYRSGSGILMSGGSTSGTDTTGNQAAWSITGSADPGLRQGDRVVVLNTVNGDASTFASHELSATGATFGTLTEQHDAGTSQGQDCGSFVVDAYVTGGPSTAAPVFTSTATGYKTGHPTGSAVILVLRAQPTATAVAAVAAVPTHVVSGGAVVAAVAVAATAAVPAPSVSTGASPDATVTPPAVAATTAVPAPAAVSGAAVAAPSTVVATAALPAPAVSGAATVPAAAVAAVAAVPAPGKSTGSTVAATAVPAVAAVPAATASGSATVAATAVATTAAVPDPGKSTGSTVTATALAATAGVPAAVASGAATVPATAVQAVAAVPAAGPSAGSAVAATALEATAAVPTPGPSTGAAVAAVALEAVAAVPTASVGTGSSATVAPAAVAAVVAVPAAALSAASTVEPSAVEAAAALPSAEASGSAAATPTAVQAAAAVPAATVDTAAGATVTATAVTATADVGTVTVAGSATAAPGAIVVAAAVPDPSVTTGATAAATAVATVATVPAVTVTAATPATVAATAVTATTAVPVVAVASDTTVTATAVAATATIPAPRVAPQAGTVAGAHRTPAGPGHADRAPAGPAGAGRTTAGPAGAGRATAGPRHADRVGPTLTGA